MVNARFVPSTTAVWLLDTNKNTHMSWVFLLNVDSVVI